VIVDSRQAPTALAVTLATVAGLVIALAVALSCPRLVVFAAPMIGMVAVGWRPAAARLAVEIDGAAADRPPAVHCFEAESAEIRARFAIAPAARGTVAAVRPVPADGLRYECEAGPAGQWSVVVTADRWGRHVPTVEVVALLHGGLIRMRSRVEVATLVAYPLPEVAPVPGIAPRTRIGRHVAAVRGHAPDFAGIRAFAPGDGLRAVNWPATARRRSLQVTERLHELANDIVVVVDGALPATGSAAAALDRAVRGVATLAWSALHAGDRVGLVCLDRRPRWYVARGGRRQFYGIVTTLLDPDDGPGAHFTGTVPPAAALPAGAAVVAFTGLLDAEFVSALMAVRRKGHRVLVVDVLPAIGLGEPGSAVELLWSFERAAMHRDLGSVGIEIRRGDENTEMPWATP
jgi:uncharacterized protein (DUF58 family)